MRVCEISIFVPSQMKMKIWNWVHPFECRNSRFK
jgi:hypothetical protein